MSDACLIAAQKFIGDAKAFDEILEDARVEALERANGNEERAEFMLPDVVNEFIDNLSMAANRNGKQLFYMVEAQNGLRRQVDQFIKQGKNPYVALRSVLETHYDAAQHAANNALVSFHAEIDAEKLGSYLSKKENHIKITKEIAELNKTKGKQGVSGDKQAQKIAKIYETHIQAARSALLKLGVPIANLEGRIFRQAFQRESLLQVPKSSFVDDMAPRVDKYRTFGRDGVTDGEVRKYVANYYDDVINGRMQDLEPTAFDAEKMKKTYAKKQSEHRYMHLKDPEDTLHIVEKYSADTFPEVMAKAIRDVHVNKALVNSFGVNTRYSFDQLKMNTATKFASQDPVMSSKISTSSSLENLHNTGTNTWNPNNYSATVAELQQLTVSTTRLVTLGGSGLVSIGDLGTAIAASYRVGAPTLGFIGKLMGSAFENIKRLPVEDQKAIMIGVEVQNAHAVASFNELVTGTSKFGRLAKGSTYLTQKMFQYNGLSWITQKAKTGATLNYKAQMFTNAGREWDKLNKGFRFSLMRGGLTPDEWNVIRSHAELLKYNFLGNDIINVDKISQIPDSAFGSIVRAGSKKNQIDAARDNLMQKVTAAVSNFADEAVPTAGTREKAMMNFGTDPGSGGRLVAALMTNLMSYPLTWMTRVAGRAMEAESPVGYVGYLLVTSLMFGATADFLKNANRGRYRDYGAMINSELSASQYTDFVVSSVMLGGFGGIASSVITDYALYGRGVSDFSNPAALGISDDVLSNLRGIMGEGAKGAAGAFGYGDGGDYNSALFKAIDTVHTLLPTQFPVVGTAFDAMVYFPMMEMFAPEKLQRLQKNFKDRTGGEYFITPD
jgi:hypothetical protein